MNKHLEIRIQGIVQGVGFRPFIYRIAYENNINGYVRNDTEGVLIHAEGSNDQINAFINEIREAPPPLSSIQSISIVERDREGYENFRITKSETSNKRLTFLPPDTTVCSECLMEFSFIKDRRYKYPFITCTNCGPRFSIIADIPYDRRNTSMDKFTMCSICQKEYDDPSDRRFHTQPNACPACGPHVSLYKSDGSLIADTLDSVVSITLKHISDSKIIAIKGVGGFLIAVDATNDKAVLELRNRKSRPFKPFAMMTGGIEKAEEFLYISPIEKSLLLSKERPIVILKEKMPYVSRHIAPFVSFHGLMLPYMPFHHLLFSHNRDMVLVMTSGNVSDEPIISKDDDAFKDLSKIADYIVIFNREIVAHSDDSVLFVEDDNQCFIRRSRGFVPVPIHTTKTDYHILATGGDLKNCFALTKDDVIILSQFLGDLATPSGNELYRKTISHFMKTYDFSPEVVVSDLHPSYFTRLFADELEGIGLKGIKAQHHHAHIASVIEDRELEGRVIGLSFDGTGFGVDGTLWGSEFLIADKSNFERIAHFSYFPLPGGESAIKDVWKIGISMLYKCYGSNIPIMNDIPLTQIILEIIDKGINSPLTCSIGRIFDGISSILGLSRSISTEAEAAMLLEEAAIKGIGNSISPLDIPIRRDKTLILQTESLTEYIITLLNEGREKEDIAYAFHHSIALATAKVADIIREEHGIERIALSGGVFQNRLLLKLILRELRRKEFDIYYPKRVPFNDGCIALGQLAIAKELLKHE
ncbi:MAG: carbamoyltransferase HypF [Spirochaetota bacterium]|nr:carbamoyltransferase HypF [Spirochaetota bacterium]